MLLTDAESGAAIRIVGFKASPSLSAKLRQLGMVPGDNARVIRRAPFDGPFLLEICGREIALGRSIAAKVLIEVIS